MSAGRRRNAEASTPVLLPPPPPLPPVREPEGPARSPPPPPPPLQFRCSNALSSAYRFFARSLYLSRLSSSLSTHFPAPGHSQLQISHRSSSRQSRSCSCPCAPITVALALQVGQFRHGGAISRHWHFRSCSLLP